MLACGLWLMIIGAALTLFATVYWPRSLVALYIPFSIYVFPIVCLSTIVIPNSSSHVVNIFITSLLNAGRARNDFSASRLFACPPEFSSA
jgi:hypothetical protein